MGLLLAISVIALYIQAQVTEAAGSAGHPTRKLLLTGPPDQATAADPHPAWTDPLTASAEGPLLHPTNRQILSIWHILSAMGSDPRLSKLSDLTPIEFEPRVLQEVSPLPPQAANDPAAIPGAYGAALPGGYAGYGGYGTYGSYGEYGLYGYGGYGGYGAYAIYGEYGGYGAYGAEAAPGGYAAAPGGRHLMMGGRLLEEWELLLDDEEMSGGGETGIHGPGRQLLQAEAADQTAGGNETINATAAAAAAPSPEADISGNPTEQSQTEEVDDQRVVGNSPALPPAANITSSLYNSSISNATEESPAEPPPGLKIPKIGILAPPVSEPTFGASEFNETGGDIGPAKRGQNFAGPAFAGNGSGT